ncbi:hypothetical protein JTB14_020307 [Gonioctena quinquepunctata]|nr:hypothetical protein JTB14_020307 [Gonioctena quinquepunctata]
MKDHVGIPEGRIIVAGDLNAKKMIWEGQETDDRGKNIMNWVVTNSYLIENNRRDKATFSSNRAESWVDLTITRGTTISGWQVEDQETLSDHRFITYHTGVETGERNENKKEDYDTNRASCGKLAQ